MNSLNYRIDPGRKSVGKFSRWPVEPIPFALRAIRAKPRLRTNSGCQGRKRLVNWHTYDAIGVANQDKKCKVAFALYVGESIQLRLRESELPRMKALSGMSDLYTDHF